MALNLWKLGGQPTSYNPLPVGTNNLINLRIGDYVFLIKAKSDSNALLRIYNGSLQFDKTITLTNVSTVYEMSFSNLVEQSLRLRDTVGKSDIIIEDIELVQKPLPKLTINGIDGFLSGKWTLHPNAKVIDDETLELNATSGIQVSTIFVDVPAGSTIILSFKEIIGQWFINKGNDNILGSELRQGSSNNVVITIPSDTTRIRLAFGNLSAGTFTFKRPMLNLGTIPAPYSKKTGDKMVMPVPKKNLFDGKWEVGWISTDTGGLSVYDTRIRSVNFFPISPNKHYELSSDTLDVSSAYSDFRVFFYDVNKNFINSYWARSAGANFVTPPNCYYFKLGCANSADVTAKLQLEEGTVTTPYEPYAIQLNPKPKKPIAKAKTGLFFNGVTDYLQLPSMTMDSIEIECLIDGVQPSVTWQMVIDVRVGNLWDNPRLGFENGVLKSPNGTLEGALVKGQRSKVKLKFNSPITNRVNVMSNLSGGEFTKGTLYKVTCYLGGQIVAQYDFENPNNIIGDKVFNGMAKQLIPYFDNPLWSLHPNLKVLGPNVGRLDSNTTWQNNDIFIDVNPGQTYYFLLETNSIYRVFNGEGTAGQDALLPYGQSKLFTPTANKVRVRLSNDKVGSFDFARPQLYLLDGKEATIVGNPVPLLKAPKRLLYPPR